MNNDHKPNFDRRQFFKYSAAALASMALAPLLRGGRAHSAFAADKALPMLTDASSPLVKQLAYTPNASKVPADKRKAADAKCANCQFYTYPAQKKAGPCQLFPGYRVAADGWCASWSKRSA